MCWTKTFNCGMCTTKNLSIVVEPTPLHPAAKLFSILSEAESLPCMENEAASVPFRVGDNSITLTELFSVKERRDICLNTTLFCATEEELLTCNMGDSDSNLCKSFETKSSLAEEKYNIHAHNFHSFRATFRIEDPLLTMLEDNPDHRLASLKHFEEYSSKTFPFLETLSSLESLNSPKRFATDSVTIPNMSSTVLFDELHQNSTSSITGDLKDTQTQQHTDGWKCGTPSTDRLFVTQPLNDRPCVPARLLSKASSNGYGPAYPSESLAADQNPGQTSTTHEVRWTQVEQDTMQTDGTTGLSIPVPFTRSNLVDAYAGDSWRWLHPTDWPSSATRPDNARPGFTFLVPPNRQACPSMFSPNASKPKLHASYTDGPSSPFDHSLPVPTDVPNFTQTLNECSWLGEPTNPVTHYVAIPERCSSSSTLECDKEDPTSLLVQHSLTRHTTVCPFTCSYSPVTSNIEGRLVCARCEAQIRACRMSKQIGTQTADGIVSWTTPTKPVGPQLEKTQFVCLTPCLSTTAPVGSGPSVITVRVKFEIEGVFAAQRGLSRADSASLLLRSVLTAGDHEIHPEKLAPLRVRQLPGKPVAHFEPFEKFQCPSWTHRSKTSKSKSSNRMTDLDINMVNDSTTQTTSSTADCTASFLDLSKSFRCTYVEVSLKRNLESVSPPACLSDIDARLVHTLLEYKLQNAVATKFMASAIKSKPSDTSSSSSTYPAPLNESGDMRPTRNASDSFPHRKLAEPVIAARPREFKSFLVRVGNMYKYLPTRTVGKTTACGGVYMFTCGPRHVRPPKPWWDHLQKEQHSCNHRSVAAWKIDGLNLIVGGLINHNCHLHVLASSNDGRLGMVYGQAVGLLAELVQKGTRYVNSHRPHPVATARTVNSNVSDSVRMYFKAPALARLIDSEVRDVSSVVGLNDLGLGVALASRHGNIKFCNRRDTITMYTTSEQFVPDLQQVRRLLAGIRRLRELSAELARSAYQLKRPVMPVESMDFLLRLLRKRASKLFVTSNEFLARGFGKTLRSVCTSYQGSLAHCIRGNAYCPQEHHPRATDPDAFNVFRELFDPILGSFALCLNARSQPLPSYEIPNSARTNSDSRCLLRYRVRFARNIAGFGFAPVMNKRDFESVEQLCKEALLSWKEEGIGCWYRLCEFEEQNANLFKSLQRKQLLMPTQTAVRQSSGAARFWPHGRSVYVAPIIYSNCDLVAQINGDDHLRVVCVDWTGKQPYLAYSRAARLMSWLDSKLQFSRSAQWGFLSPSLSNVGTGMHLSGWLRISTLERKVTTVERLCTRYRLQVCSTCPHGFTSHYRLLDVAPISTLGRTEAEIMMCFIESVQRVYRLYEKSLRD